MVSQVDGHMVKSDGHCGWKNFTANIQETSNRMDKNSNMSGCIHITLQILAVKCCISFIIPGVSKVLGDPQSSPRQMGMQMGLQAMGPWADEGLG